jgi:hypothetical protein
VRLTFCAAMRHVRKTDAMRNDLGAVIVDLSVRHSEGLGCSWFPNGGRVEAKIGRTEHRFGDSFLVMIEFVAA